MEQLHKELNAHNVKIESMKTFTTNALRVMNIIIDIAAP